MDERVKYVATIVSEVTGVSVENIMGKKRSRPYANARKMMSKILIQFFEMGVSEQERCGVADHATVCNRIKMFEEHYATELEFKYTYDTIKRIVASKNVRIFDITALTKELAIVEARAEFLKHKIEHYNEYTQANPEHRDVFHVES